MTSRSIVALLTETELSRFAHSASDPLGEGAAGAGASAVEERRTEGAAMGEDGSISSQQSRSPLTLRPHPLTHPHPPSPTLIHSL